MSGRYGGQKPEVWELARMVWPQQPAIQDAYVDAITSIEAAGFAIDRLPQRVDRVEGTDPLDEVQAKLAEALNTLSDWARSPLA